MKRLLFCLLAVLFLAGSAQAALTYGLAKYQQMRNSDLSRTPSDFFYQFVNEIETEIEATGLEGGTTLTFSTNSGTFDNVTNNTFRWGELSEYLTLTFSSNATAWSSSTGVVLMDFATVVPKTDQLLLDPVADAVGTVEGTLFYDSDDDNVYVYKSAGWTSLGSGTFTGGSITSDVTLSNAVDIMSTTTTGQAATIKVYDNDTGPAYTNVLSWTNGNVPGIAMGSDTSTFALNSTTIDIAAGDVSGVTTLNASGLVTAGGLTSTGAAVNLNVSSNFATNINTGTSNAAVTIGNGTGTVEIVSTGVDISTAGAISGVTTISMNGDLSLATATAIKGTTTTGNTISLQVYDNDTGPGYKDAILLTNGNTPTMTIGDGNPTVAINSSDWDISTAGAMTGIGAITSDGLYTGSAGATITGAAINLNASSNFAVNIGTGTTNAQVTIGAGTAPFAVNSTAFDVDNAGAVSGVTTLSLSDDITMANGKAIKGTTTTGNTIKLQSYDNDTGPGYKDALTITNGNTPGISLGGNTNTVAIDSTDWDIDATGAMTGIGAITADGLITGSLGLTITAATVSLNASSNFGTNINTGTSNGAVAIGGGSGTVAVISSDWTVSTAGAMTKIASIGFDSVTGIYHDTIELSNADIKALRATKKGLVAAPGAANIVELVSAVLILDYGTNVLTESADNMVIEYITSGQDATGAIEATGFIDAAADTVCTVYPAAIPTVAAANLLNNGLQLFNTGDGEYAGNAGNDTTMTIKIAYRIHPAGL